MSFWWPLLSWRFLCQWLYPRIPDSEKRQRLLTPRPISSPSKQRYRFWRQTPSSGRARIQLALALLDQIPDRALGSVKKGLLSSEALATLSPVLAAFPDSWGLQVLVGTIHLNWFTKLGHVPSSILAFRRAVSLFEKRVEKETLAGSSLTAVAAAASLGSGPGASPTPSGYAEAFRALGDALIKSDSFPHARREWKAGAKYFPDNPGLKERLSFTAPVIAGYVERWRSWDCVVDTDAVSESIGDLPPLPDGTLSEDPANR